MGRRSLGVMWLFGVGSALQPSVRLDGLQSADDAQVLHTILRVEFNSTDALYGMHLQLGMSASPQQTRRDFPAYLPMSGHPSLLRLPEGNGGCRDDAVVALNADTAGNGFRGFALGLYYDAPVTVPCFVFVALDGNVPCATPRYVLAATGVPATLCASQIDPGGTLNDCRTQPVAPPHPAPPPTLPPPTPPRPPPSPEPSPPPPPTPKPPPAATAPSTPPPRPQSPPRAPPAASLPPSPPPVPNPPIRFQGRTTWTSPGLLSFDTEKNGSHVAKLAEEGIPTASTVLSSRVYAVNTFPLPSGVNRNAAVDAARWICNQTTPPTTECTVTVGATGARARRRLQQDAGETVRVQYLMYDTNVYNGQLNASEATMAAALSELLNTSVQVERNGSSVEVMVAYAYPPPQNTYISAELALSLLQDLVNQASVNIAVYLQVPLDAVRSSGTVTVPPAPPPPPPHAVPSLPMPLPAPRASPPPPASRDPYPRPPPPLADTQGAVGAPLASAYVFIVLLSLYWETLLFCPRGAYLGFADDRRFTTAVHQVHVAEGA